MTGWRGVSGESCPSVLRPGPSEASELLGVLERSADRAQYLKHQVWSLPLLLGVILLVGVPVVVPRPLGSRQVATASGLISVAGVAGHSSWYWIGSLSAILALSGLLRLYRQPLAQALVIFPPLFVAEGVGVLIEVIGRGANLQANLVVLVMVAAVLCLVSAFERSRTLAWTGCAFVIAATPLVVLPVALPGRLGLLLPPRSATEALAGLALICIALATWYRPGVFRVLDRDPAHHLHRLLSRIA